MFSERFWQGVQVLTQMVKEARPLVGSTEVRELHSRLEDLPPHVQEQLQHDLKILIAALTQSERMIQVHRPTMDGRLTHFRFLPKLHPDKSLPKLPQP